MADYDVLPYSVEFARTLVDLQLTTCITHDHVVYSHEHPAPMFSLHGNCPALVIGTAEQFADVCQWFLDFKPPADLKHTSDMYLFEQMILAHPEKFKVSMDCVLFSDAGWETAAAIHFSNSVMAPNYIPKYKHIPLLRS